MTCFRSYLTYEVGRYYLCLEQRPDHRPLCGIRHNSRRLYHQPSLAWRVWNRYVPIAIPQYLTPPNILVPPRIAKQRTIFASSLFTFCLAGTFFLLSYFIPIYFQAVKGKSALASGIDTIPLILPNVIGILFAGFGTAKIGYYVPFIYLAVLIAPVGAGLLTTLKPDTTTAKWIGYQILFGFGSGCGFQLPQVAAQVVLPPRDIPMGISVSMLFQGLGGAVLISAANNVLNAKLFTYVDALGIPGVSGMDIINAGATGFRDVVPAGHVGEVINVYNRALRKAFQIAVIMACLSALPAVLLEWKSVKKGPVSGPKMVAKEDSLASGDVEKSSGYGASG